jgi:hypothetical protein
MDYGIVSFKLKNKNITQNQMIASKQEVKKSNNMTKS